MTGLLLEILLDDQAMRLAGSPDVLVVSAALDDALSAADLGEIVGFIEAGGSTSIDVELDDALRSAEAVRLIRRVLKGLGLPAATPIYRCDETDDEPEVVLRPPLPLSAALFDPSWSRCRPYLGYDPGRVAS